MKVYWHKGKNNDADYFTKTHTTPHHRSMRPNYVQDKINCITNATDKDLHIYF